MKGLELFEKINENVGRVISGNKEVTFRLMVAMIAGGHVLLEDLPGSGKTTLAKALAKSISCDFNRIQFTPDLLPGDITGIRAYNQATSEFYMKKGPVFTNILLADEVNRATPRTQAGLLECMEERQVTIDGERFELSEPFMVIATQNPIESYGTYPLPEAQMDRFLMKLCMEETTKEGLNNILHMQGKVEFSIDALKPVASVEDIAEASKAMKDIHVDDSVFSYITDIIKMTGEDNRLKTGVSTRAAIALLNVSKAAAYLRGKEFLTPTEVKEMALFVLPHRFYLNNTTDSATDILKDILSRVAVPTEKFD